MKKEPPVDFEHLYINGQKVSVLDKLAQEGSCSESDPDMFFPEGKEHVALIRSAKSICAECPVASLCLDYAVNTKQWGIWGGTTMKERKLLKRESARSEYILTLRRTKGRRDIAKLEDENSIEFN
jgi:WhiB family redox-sensing transcriptional regulator